MLFPDCLDPVSQLCPLLLHPLFLLGNEGRTRADDPADEMPFEQFDMVCLGGGVAAGEATRLIQPALKALYCRRPGSLAGGDRFRRSRAATLGTSFGLPCLHSCTFLFPSPHRLHSSSEASTGRVRHVPTYSSSAAQSSATSAAAARRVVCSHSKHTNTILHFLNIDPRNYCSEGEREQGMPRVLKQRPSPFGQARAPARPLGSHGRIPPACSYVIPTGQQSNRHR